MKQRQKKRIMGNWQRGLLSAMGVAALTAALTVIPAQAQVPAIEFGACGPMDVVFIIDTTGSMGDAIGNIQADLSGAGGIIETIVNAAGEDFVPAEEARLGLVVVNGSGSPTFDGQQYDCSIIDANLDTLDPPLPGIGDCILVLRDLGSSTILEVENSISGLVAGNGGATPEITADALRTVLQLMPQTPLMVGGPTPEASAPVAGIDLPDGWPRLQWNDWTGTFNPLAKKVVFLVTDDVPGGYNNVFEAADQALADQMAADYAAAGITIQPILVAVERCVGGGSDGLRIPTQVTEGNCTAGGGLAAEFFLPEAESIMQKYADLTGGTLTKVPRDGTGTGLSIISIIENCGGAPEPLQGRMTGGGSVFHENDKKNPRVTHGFTLHCDGGPNNLQVNWPGHRFHLESLSEVICTDDPEKDEQHPVAGFDTMTGRGLGRLNGVSGATIAFTFVDDGEPGKVSDTARMVISDSDGVVLEVEGTITKGNQQAHKEN